MKHELDDDSILELPDGTPYTEDQRYGFFIGLAEHYGTQYQRDRQQTYPSLGNQLDMLWHELNNSGSLTTDGEWFNQIKTVKENHPKTNI
jgi:hypothetical protein